MKLNSYEKWKSSAQSLADEYFSAGNARGAYVLLSKIVRVNPGEIEARRKLLSAAGSLGMSDAARRETLLQAQLAVRDGEAAAAYRLFFDLLSRYPDDPGLKRKTAELAAAAGEKESAAELLSSLADHYAKARLPEKAAQIYRELLTLFPEKFEILESLGEIQLEQGDPQGAKRSLSDLARRYYQKGLLAESARVYGRVVSMDPADDESAFALIRVHLAQKNLLESLNHGQERIGARLASGDEDGAITLNQRFFELLSSQGYPEEANAERERLARLLCEKGTSAKAVPLLTQTSEYYRASRQIDKFLEISKLLVKLYWEKGKMEQAVEMNVNAILSLIPSAKDKAGEWIEQLIKEMMRRERVPELDKALRKVALRLEEEGDAQSSEEILARLAEIYVSIYKIRDALGVYQKIAEKGVRKPDTWVRMAELSAKDNKLSSALDYYVKAAELFAAERNFESADELAAKALQKDPKNPAVHARLGQICYGLGMWEKSLDYYGKSLALDPGFRRALVGTAMVYAKKGMLQDVASMAKRLVAKGMVAEIVEEYKKALALSASPEECAFSLGLLYKDLGFLDEAIFEFNKASKIPKLFMQSSRELGECFRIQGFDGLAIRQYKKALEKGGYSEEETLEIRYCLAVAYQEVKMPREAGELFNDIMVTDIGYKDVKERLKRLSQGEPSGKIISLPPGSERGGKKR